MTVFEDDTGLRQGVEEEFKQFEAALSPYIKKLSEIGIKILIWGPGEGTSYYHKRNEIKEFLKQQNKNNEPATSEDLVRNIEHPTEIDIVQLEMLHANVADVIFGLVTSDPRQTGIYMEVDNLLRFESLINKTWLIVPHPKDWKKSGSFIQEPLLKSFPDYRMKPFRIKVLDECKEVRRFCLEKVKEARGRIMRKHVQSVLSGG